jgi:hypothetical protein
LAAFSARNFHGSEIKNAFFYFSERRRPEASAGGRLLRSPVESHLIKKRKSRVVFFELEPVVNLFQRGVCGRRAGSRPGIMP